MAIKNNTVNQKSQVVGVRQKRKVQKEQSKSEFYLNKLWKNKFLVALIFTSILTGFTNFEGIRALTGSVMIAVCGTPASILLFMASWHELAKQDLVNGFRKNILALSLIGIMIFGASVTFSSVGFFKTTKSASSTEISLTNNNIGEFENAQAVLPNIFQQMNKNLNDEIEIKNQAITAKTEELKTTAKKLQNLVQKQIKSLEAERQEIVDKRNELATLKVPDSVQNINFEKTEGVKAAIEEINIIAQRLITEGKISEIPEDWKQSLTYQQPKKVDVEAAFFQQLKAGETSAWLIFLLALGIDLVQVASLWAERQVPILENRIKQTKSWMGRNLKAIFSWKTNPTVKDVDLDIQLNSGNTELVTISAETLKSSIDKNQPIVIEVGGAAIVHYSNNGNSMGVRK